ncbi:cytochrome ubiquinol oxidase subunit I [Alicyclobacillus sp. SO9]|uniref:cytochrome ubiquinol oxidase subunit I n=1 Tax=Alicyclobacillus sp. SO9 TaxID=2665646 RepID=UPI0018E72A95|nr:cytochrome ubiquinol oxidase subunit I [Alicyclobacillus sp. SO9]QQE78284.1 cytochrome ubiquinol oxidase subunit I [Alicyclobacillus sp. SO9]
MSHVMLARALFGMTLGYHIAYATISVGAPLLIFIAEWRFMRTGQPFYRILAKRITLVLILLVGVGLVTGTSVAVMLSVLWPGFMKTVGQVINLPFQIEVFAFMIESLFLAVYVYGGSRLSQRARLISTLLVAVGSGMSALLITDVNAFMNTPTGFVWHDGQVTHAHPLLAMFNPAMPTELAHVLASAYMTVGFVFAAVAARGLLRKNTTSFEKEYYRRSLNLSLWVAGTMSVLTAFIGDLSGKFLEQFQPEKLAAAEGLFKTTQHAPLVIGGWPSLHTESVIGGIPVPGMLSWLATESFHGKVLGLNHFPKSTWPPLFVHLLFDSMVGIGSVGIAVAVVYLFVRLRRTNTDTPRWLLWGITGMGLLSMIGIEDGWVFAEIARQPWIIYGYLKVSQAVTTSPSIGWMLAGFMSLYTVLLIGTVWALRAYFKNHPLCDEDSLRPDSGTKPGKRGKTA